MYVFESYILGSSRRKRQNLLIYFSKSLIFTLKSVDNSAWNLFSSPATVSSTFAKEFLNLLTGVFRSNKNGKLAAIKAYFVPRREH